MDHRYNYFHQNPNALPNGQPAYDRLSSDVTRPTNNHHSGSISSTSSRDQSPFNERQRNPNAAPITNNHLYQMDSYNQLPRSFGPPRTNAKGIHDSPQSSISNVLSLAQSSAENYPINPDFQLQPHLTGLLPQQSKTIPEVYPKVNYRDSKESIAANMNTNYFSSNTSYPEPNIIEYDIGETSTESSPQHTSSLYSESTDQDSESTHPNNAFPRHTLNKNIDYPVTKESKPLTSQSEEIPVPSQFADLNLTTNDTVDEQHSILHNAYQNDISEDIILSENNEVEPILENKENLESQFNQQSFSASKTQPYNYFSNSKDQSLTELNYENKQGSSPLVSNSSTNFSLNNVNNPSNIQNPYFSQSSISMKTDSLKNSDLQSSSKPLLPDTNTEKLINKETSNIQNYEDKVLLENYNQQQNIVDTNFSQLDSKLQSNIINSNMQENVILNQSTPQAQPPLNTKSGDFSIYSNAVDSCHQQNIQNVESANHQSIYSSLKPSASELNSGQSINTNNSLKSTQIVDTVTPTASTYPSSRSSSSISEAIVKQNQSSPYHLSEDQAMNNLKSYSTVENNTNYLTTQDSTKIVKSDFDDTKFHSSSKNLFQNQQEIIIDQSKPIDKLSYDSKDQQCNSQPSLSSTNVTRPDNYTYPSVSNYQQLHQSTFQHSTAVGSSKTTINDQFSSNSINLTSQSLKNQSLITQPSISTTNHSISKYFDTVNLSNRSVLNQQSSNEQPYSTSQNAHIQELKPVTSSFSSSDKFKNLMCSSDVQNIGEATFSNQQPSSTNMKLEATQSFNLENNMSSKEIASNSLKTNYLIKDSFQNSENKTSNSQMPDNVTPNDQFSSSTIGINQNNMVASEILNCEKTSAPQISKETYNKEENSSECQNMSTRVNESNNSAAERSNINSTSYFATSENTISPTADINQPAAYQFSSQQFNNKVDSNETLSYPSVNNQWPSNTINSNIPISDIPLTTSQQQPTQSFSKQPSTNLSPNRIYNNQLNLDAAPPLQSIPSTDVHVPAVNQFPPQIFSNQPKSDAISSLQQFNSLSLNSTQQFNILQTPNTVPPVTSVSNQFPQQMFSNQPKSSSTLPQTISSPYSTQLFNNQQTPVLVTPVTSAFNQLPPSTLSNQTKSDYLPTTLNNHPFKTMKHQSTVSDVPSNNKQFPPQMSSGPVKSEVVPSLQTATSTHVLHSFNNQPTQNAVPFKSNQLPPSVFGNPSNLNNLPPFQLATSQHMPQNLSNQLTMNAVSPEPYNVNQVPPHVFGNQSKADVPSVPTPSNWYSPSHSFNNQQMSNIAPPVPSVVNQLPPHIFSSQSKSDVVSPLQPKSNQYPPQQSNSQSRSTMSIPDSTISNLVPLQLSNNQPMLGTRLSNKEASNQYPTLPLSNQSTPNTPLNQQVAANKYPLQSFSNQQGVSNQQPPSNQFYNQPSLAQHNQRVPLPSTSQPKELSTIPLSSANFPNQISPMLSQQKSANLASNMTNMPAPNMPPQMLPPNSLSSNNNFNQVQGIRNIQQSQPQMLPGQNVQFPLQSNTGISNQINYQQSGADYGQGLQYQPQTPYMPEQNASVVQQGFAKTWGHDTLDLLKSRNVLPSDGVQPPEIKLPHGYSNCDNCSPDIFRCTMNKFPSSKNLLDKSRLPLGILIHPYKDLSRLTVIQCETITRCRNCRSYINPFVQFIDNAHWKCNLCYRVNELPGEFQIDPYTKRLGDPSRRPEILNATIEYIASQDYMVRPPQPALYLFLLDVSRIATLTGYLEIVCDRILNKILGSEIPGDSRTNIGFITYDSSVHFYQIANNDGGQPKQLVVSDVSDIFLPLPDGLMVNLEENKSAIKDLLTSLPNLYKESYNTGCALGAALQAAFKILAPRGGRVTVFQACLPNVGPGSLQPRDDGVPHVGDRVQHMTPSTDFYKKLALECSAEQIAVDMFFISPQYLDIATISGISKYSAGCIHNFPQFDVKSPTNVTQLINCFDRYLSRKIGFEALLRLRCTRGVAIHSFHGNFFVRSSDLLMLPNVNPDNAYGMQLSIEDSLDGVSVVCFQAALLYTSSNAERRIRVHTLCIPVTDNLNDVFHNADQQAITCLIAKMAVDRSTEKSLSDAREAFFNAITDSLSAFKLGCSSYNGPGTMLCPLSLKVFPMYILAMLKHEAFRTNQPTRLDQRMFSMCQMKSLPLNSLVQYIYPDLYPIHDLEEQPKVDYEKLTEIPLPPVIQLSAERIESNGIFLMDDSETLTIFIGYRCSDQLIQKLFGYVNVNSMPELITSLPEVDSKLSYLLRSFISYLQHFKSYPLPIEIIKDNGPHKLRFYSRLIEDKFETSLSYYEFLQRLSQQVR